MTMTIWITLGYVPIFILFLISQHARPEPIDALDLLVISVGTLMGPFTIALIIGVMIHLYRQRLARK